MSLYPPIALHPIDRPVQTLEQADAAMESQSAWISLSMRGPRAAEIQRLQPVDGEWPTNEGQVRELCELRLTEAIALRVWAQMEAARAGAPPPTLPDLSWLTGLSLSRFSNGPDEAAGYALAEAKFALPVPLPDAQEQSRRQDALLTALRTAWAPERVGSPLEKALFVLANRKPDKWVMDLTSFAALEVSLFEPEALAARRRNALEKQLPEGLASPGARPRM